MLATRSLKASPRHNQDWLSPRCWLKTDTAPAKGPMGDFPKKHGHCAHISAAVDQRLRDNVVALVQHFPCRAHGLGLKNEAGALLDGRSPGGALWKEAVLSVPPNKPGHSQTQLWTRKGDKPLPRLP